MLCTWACKKWFLTRALTRSPKAFLIHWMGRSLHMIQQQSSFHLERKLHYSGEVRHYNIFHIDFENGNHSYFSWFCAEILLLSPLKVVEMYIQLCATSDENTLNFILRSKRNTRAYFFTAVKVVALVRHITRTTNWQYPAKTVTLNPLVTSPSERILIHERFW